MEYSQMIDAGKAIEYWINVHHGSLSKFARKLISKEEVKELFSGEQFDETRVRSKLQWIKNKRTLKPDDIGQLKFVYGIDPDEAINEYAKAMGISIKGNNNVTNSNGSSVSINEPDSVLLTEINFLKKEIKMLKEHIAQKDQTIELLQNLLNPQKKGEG